jgi:oxygen-dependent protoporphyrinogen oxidase
VRIVVVGGGIAGLAAARRVESRLPDARVVLLERAERLGGKLLTERTDGFVVEGAADSFLSRKPRGVGLAEELGLELVGRRPEHARSFVRVGPELHPLPEGLTGMIPTNLEALESTTLLSAEGKARLAAEADVPPAAGDEDETVASFVTRRLGPEAYERLVEPLMTGIYGGDGAQLSLQATFPQLRELELEHGSVLRGLRAQSRAAPGRPPFVSLRAGMGELVGACAGSLSRTDIRRGRAATRICPGLEVEVDGGEPIAADGVVVAAPAFAAAELLEGLSFELAESLRAIPYGSSAIVTLALPERDLGRPLDGYGYVVPAAADSDALAVTWSSSKWEGRAPAGVALVRVYLGRFGRRDVTALPDAELVELARSELAAANVDAEPRRTWVHRWARGMPQYVLGHVERVAAIDAELAELPGLEVAGAAYRGVGIPDCIASGEAAADAIARSLAGVA